MKTLLIGFTLMTSLISISSVASTCGNEYSETYNTDSNIVSLIASTETVMVSPRSPSSSEQKPNIQDELAQCTQDDCTLKALFSRLSKNYPEREKAYREMHFLESQIIATKDRLTFTQFKSRKLGEIDSFYCSLLRIQKNQYVCLHGEKY